MTLIQPTPEQLQNIYSELKMTPEGIERDVKYLEEWVKQQPHLPQHIDENRLRHLLFFCKNSVEKVKRVVDLYYTVRGQVPEFFKNRDPLSPELQKGLDNVCMVVLPKLTPEGSRIIVFHLKDPDPLLYDACLTMKICFMAGDLRLLEDTCLSDIFVFNLTSFSLTHLMYHTLPLVKKFMFVGTRAFPIRQKAIHIIYAPKFVDKVVMLFKPFMKEKLAKRFYVHSEGFGDLFDHVPQNLLPKDYGGDQPSISELREQWVKKLIDNRDFFLKEETAITDENKRPGQPKTSEDLFGMEGSFRSLSVD